MRLKLEGLKRFRKSFVISGIAIFLYLLLLSLGSLEIPRLKMQDFLLRLKYRLRAIPRETEEIVLVGIGDEDYYRFDERWPWSREIFAGLIYSIAEDKPKVIGLNLGFLGRSNGSEVSDMVLKEAFRDAGCVVGASYFGPEGQYFTPHEYFTGSFKDYGFTNRPIDEDSVVRRVKLFARSALTGEIIDYSFDIKLICAYYGIPVESIVCSGKKLILAREGGDIEIPVDEDGLCLVNYSVSSGDVETVPILDIISGKEPEGIFKDKIVLVGTTGKIFHDQNLTPLGEMIGGAIIANSVLMVLGEHYIYEIPEGLNILVFICLITVTGTWFGKTRIIKRFFVAIAVLSGYFVVSLVLAINNIFWDFFSVPVFIIASFIATEIVGYGTLLMESIRLKNVVITDALTGLATRRHFLVKLQNALEKRLREKQNLSVVVLSIDNFDGLVSGLGPDEGDAIVKTIAELIEVNSRRAKRVDFIARYAESEFSVILRNTPDRGAVKYTRRIKRVLEKERVTDRGNRFRINLSAGIVSSNLVVTGSAKAFMECAQKVLHRARQGLPHGEKVLVYDSDIDKVPVEEERAGKEMDESDLSFVAKELEEKNRELKEMINKLRATYNDIVKNERLMATGRLASSIHHELNNPLSALRSCLESVYKNLDRGEAPVQKNKEFISLALEEIQRMFEMSRNLKDIYKPPKKELEQVNINEILEEILVLSKDQIQAQNIKLVKKFQADVPEVEANRAELKQAFLNILMNAQDSMPKGGEIRISTVVVREESGRRLEIQIADTGCGMPEEILDKIFDPFFTTREEGKGAGLGLYVTKQIIEKYMGNVEVKSEINKGTTFYVRFPVG